jgi:hypothetical protein
MGGGCDDRSRTSRLNGARPRRHSLGQVNPGAAHADSIGADQQNQTTAPSDSAQSAGNFGRVRRPERSVRQASPARQGEGERHGVGRALGVCEQDRERQSARKGLPARGCPA